MKYVEVKESPANSYLSGHAIGQVTFDWNTPLGPDDVKTVEGIAVKVAGIFSCELATEMLPDFRDDVLCRLGVEFKGRHARGAWETFEKEVNSNA